MFAQKAYWIETRTSRSYESMDEEEHAALVSIMRNLASFCGINILTYRISSGNLSMLASCPSREHHLEFFQDSESEAMGSGMRRLFKHLRKLYTSSHVEALAAEYESLKRHNEDIQPFWEQCTRRIGTPRKFAEGINEAFARWIKKNRPQLYESLEGKVCRKDINQTYLEQLQKQRDVAFSMDEDAIFGDDGSEPRKYWCGYADAMRGDENALDGLRELMRSPAKNTSEINDLGYSNQRPHKEEKKEAGTPRTRTKPSRSSAKPSVINTNNKVDHLAEHMAPKTSAPPKPIARALKIKLMGAVVLLLVIICAIGTTFALKEWREYKTNKQELDITRTGASTSGATESTSAPPEKLENVQTEADSKKEKLAQLTARLYEPAARQLANDFGMSTDPQARLKMCRHQNQISKRLNHYSKQILSDAATEVTFLDVAELGDITAARFLAKFTNGQSRLICIVSTEDGLRVDLDSYTRYNSLAIPSLLAGGVKSAELRVYLERCDYYNFLFKDELKWSSFILRSPDSDEIIYAYIQRQTTTGKQLDAILSRAPRQTLQVTLQISSRQDSHKRKQFTIDRVYAVGWLRSENDLDEIDRAEREGLANERE
ncbi:MAG: hypothetical protein P8P36_01745 [Akkermansiaceae bacterium]|nr:hypothetical protein [Akkermansiaceae bacterium]